MQCDQCHRDLAEDAPVWLCYRSLPPGSGRSGWAVTTMLFCENCKPYDPNPVPGEDFFQLPGESERDAIRRHFGNQPALNSRFRASNCGACGRMVTAPRSLLKKYWVCSRGCRKALRLRLLREANEKRREGMICDACGAAFTPKRSDARTCSSTCRQKAYRSSKKLGAVAL